MLVVYEYELEFMVSNVDIFPLFSLRSAMLTGYVTNTLDFKFLHKT